MKNLSGIHRLSLSETFTILITLVVCLAGFSVAEVNENYRKEDPNKVKENLPSRDTSKVTGDELEGRGFDNLKNLPESQLNLDKTQLANIGESDEYNQKESYGYGYDDDDYYHFNFKRNDPDSKKQEFEHGGTKSLKTDMSGQKFMSSKMKQKPNEYETIEMLNFKETHPNMGTENNSPSKENSKKYNMKNSNSPSMPSLKIDDLRENSAIEGKYKENKEESSLNGGSSESKLVETKKSEEKSSAKLKDSTDDSEKKEKEICLKDEKQAIAPKPLKETSDEKDKTVKLTETSKLEQSEKLIGKNKETESKVKEGTDDAKISSDLISPTGLSGKSNRASFVSSDYKDSLDSTKASAVEGDEKTLEESNGVESNTALNEYQKGELKHNPDSLRKLYNYKNLESSGEYTREIPIKIYQEPSKQTNLFNDLQALNNEIFKKREWKEPTVKYHVTLQSAALPEQHSSLEQLPQNSDAISQEAQRFLQEQEKALLQTDQMSQMPQEMNIDSRLKNTLGLNLPQNMLENTEYHKNFLKSLKRYKSMSDEQRGLPDANSGASSSVKNSFCEVPSQGTTRLRSVSEGKEFAQIKHSRRDTFNKGSSPRSGIFGESESSLEDSWDKTNSDKARERRKSQKLEYEIKVINHSPRVENAAEFSHGSKRFEKDLKSESSDRYLKKYPYTQVSRDDLFNMGNLNTEKKTKRKARSWKQYAQKSLIQPRAVPSGYYSNRVKFGQKSLSRNNDRTENSELTSFTQNSVSPPSLSNQLIVSPTDKNKMLRSWETPQQEVKHEPMKRYDTNGSPNKGSPLLLVRKSDQVATSFEEETPRLVTDTDMNSGNLANMLSGNKNYLFLKNPENENFQKLSDSKQVPNNFGFSQFSIPTYNTDSTQRGDLKKSSKQPLKNKGLFTRSSHTYKDDRKFSSGLHSSKSNLKKTFEKFRDLAGFFKDNEQESSDNQYQAQELKEGRDIVFSEDKLPDPIVINSDGNEKFQNFNQKPLNSIYSISTNFKTLDQQEKKPELPSGSEGDKNMFTAEAKSDNLESSWEPTLKNAFPEAKSINAMSKNGNEIIILDLNRNQLKPTHQLNQMRAPAKPQQYGAFGFTSQLPMMNPSGGDKKIQMSFNTPQQINTNTKKNTYKITSPDIQPGKAYISMKETDNAPMEGLSALLRALMDTKVVTKRSLPVEYSSAAENYDKILKKINELSNISNKNMKKIKVDDKRSDNDVTYSSSSSLSELSSYGNQNVKYLGNLLKDIMASSENNMKTSNALVLHPDSAENIQKHPEATYNYLNLWPVSEFDSETKLKTGDNLLTNKAQERNRFWEELSPTSGDRLRREETEKQKIRKGSLVDAPESKYPISDTNICQSFCPEPFPDQSQATEISNVENQQKAEYDNQLNEFFENLYKSQKSPMNLPNESTWKRKKRKEIHREKRSAENDNKNKVSTTAEHNTILKNLAEDNYQSVYSPGIRRRLFSTANEADDAENNSDAYEHNNDVPVEKAQPNSVKNSFNKFIDPTILEIFRDPEEEGEEEKEEDKIRSRRSLNPGFHSNFKREIDLDESMPNDFQNFLVTSVGGFGSQTREGLKKEDAFLEGKANFQDGVLEPNEDSFLAKRDVSSIEKKKSSTLGKRYLSTEDSNSNQNLNNIMNPLQQGDHKSKVSVKDEFNDEKLPTQIRIQVTNASAKEKKSSKPIMEESETTSTETENLPKEKEFLDKNKGSVREEITKLRNPSREKFDFSRLYEPEAGSYNRRRRKKKKYVLEDPEKPVKDFIAFDQKAMESLLRKVSNQQNTMADQTTHRSPIGNHLPQVETVYNPAQESNKAQLHPSRLKTIVGNTNNRVSAKTNLQEEASTTNLKKDELNSENTKEEEVMDWSNLKKLNKNSPQNSMWDFPNVNLKSTFDAFENEPSTFLFPYNQKHYHHSAPLHSNYFCHIPADSGLNAYSLYNALKLRQELKSKNEFRNQHHDSKLGRKNMRFGDENLFAENSKEKSPNSMLSYGANEYLAKNPILPGIKNKLSRPYDQEEKLPYLEYIEKDNPNNIDYLDGIEDDYLEWLDNNEPSVTNTNSLHSEDYSILNPMAKIGKKSFETPSFRSSYLKNTDTGDEEEEETEDYSENLEDEEPENFSPITGKSAISPTLPKYDDRRELLSSLLDNVGIAPLKEYLYSNRNLKLKGENPDEMKSPRAEAKFIPEGQFPEEDIKPDSGLSSGSTDLLKKANRNSNILERNLIKNTYGFDLNNWNAFERNWDIPTRPARKIILPESAYRKRRREYPTIGKRLFFVTKGQIHNVNPSLDCNQNERSEIVRQPHQNLFSAAFADPENSFESESEENGKRFSNSFLTQGENFGNENMELNDIRENLEDDGETISKDNILENVIGKYIVRKRVASSADLSKANETPLIKETTDKHKIMKRSLEKSEGVPANKLITKRLSSGHLTENNFRKYHKKNLSKKQAEVTDTDGFETSKKREITTIIKRSALDIFKRITNKERESKKVESSDCRSAGFEPLLSLNDKNYETPNLESSSQSKKLISNDNQGHYNSVQLKSSYPVDTSPALDQKKKEKLKTNENLEVAAQGPWKVELKDNFDKKTLSGLNKIERVPAKLENPKTILVFTTNAIVPERNADEELSPVSGFFQKEVGNSYRPNYDEGRGSSKRHFRKRSLDSSLSSITHEDAAQRNHFIKRAVNLEDTNRALHDKKSLSEGDSITELPHVIQRNSKKIRSFVNAVDTYQNVRLPSTESSNKRKSIFPPSNDANILRDSRHINEETSKYLSQQIVDAIWSHVSTNPKLKELIAPALAVRMTANKEDVGIRKRPIEEQQQDNSDQLQYFLQKFMNDLEKLTEKHVKKRMCNKIDLQSKRFLQSLLSVPLNSPSQNKFRNEKFCQCPYNSVRSRLESTKSFMNDPSSRAEYVENLYKKHFLLTKLIDDYTRLSSLEQEPLGMDYNKLVNELYKTRSEMSSLNIPWYTPNPNYSQYNSETVNSNPGLACSVCKPIPKRPPPNPNGGGANESTEGHQPTINWYYSERKPKQKAKSLFFDEKIMKNARTEAEKQNHYNPEQSSQPIQQKQSPQVFQTYVFQEDSSKNIVCPQVKQPSSYEVVEPANITNNNEGRMQNMTQRQESTQILSSPPSTPETYNLLPSQTSSEKIENRQSTENSNNADESESQISESTTKRESDKPLLDTIESSELHKLSVGDAAGLQLSLNNRNPWVSVLDTEKSSSDQSNVKLDLENSKDQTDKGLNADILKSRSTQDLQSNLKNTHLMEKLSPESFRTEVEAESGQKRIFHRSNDPSRFKKDQTSVREAEIYPWTTKQEKREDSETSDKDDFEGEYLTWSTMPAVRRQLNNLETGLEIDDLFSKISKLRKT